MRRKRTCKSLLISGNTPHAAVAFVWRFVFYKSHGLIVVLFAASALVPLINWALPKQRFEWRKAVA